MHNSNLFGSFLYIDERNTTLKNSPDEIKLVGKYAHKASVSRRGRTIYS